MIGLQQTNCDQFIYRSWRYGNSYRSASELIAEAGRRWQTNHTTLKRNYRSRQLGDFCGNQSEAECCNQTDNKQQEAMF
jgi:hypothetical protein